MGCKELFAIFLVMPFMCMTLFQNSFAQSEETAVHADSTSVADTTSSAQADSVGGDDYIPMGDYRYVMVGGGSRADSLYEGYLGGVVLGFNKISDKVALEWHFPGFVKVIRFTARRDHVRLAGTSLIQGVLIWVSGWSALISGNEKFFIGTLLPITQLPFGTHIAFRPTHDMAFFAGIVPDFMIFTDDDGILWRYRFGFRFIVPKTWTGLEITAVKSHFSAWEQESRTYGWSFGINWMIDPDFWGPDR